MYRVRKSWDNPKSQIGAYKSLDLAIKKCDEAKGYSVYNENGKNVYCTGIKPVRTMAYEAKIKKKIGSHKVGEKVYVHRTKKKEWILKDGTVIPDRKTYLDLTKQLFNPDLKYNKTQAENFVNSEGFSSSTGYLFWCNKYGQRVYIFKGKKGKWKLEKKFKCGTGNIAYGDPSDQGVGFSWKIYDKVKEFKGPRGTQYYNMHYSSPSGNSIHKGTTGKPSTHGCIALSSAASQWCFANLPINTKVIVY